MTYEPKVYRDKGGDRLTVADGGEFKVEKGSDFVPGQVEDKTGGTPILYFFNIPDTAGNYDITVKEKIRVIDAWGVNLAAGHATDDTWQVKNGTDAITDAVAKTATDKAIKSAETIDKAHHEVDAGGTLRVTASKDTNCAVAVYVLAIRV